MVRSPVPVLQKSASPLSGAHSPVVDLDPAAAAPLYEQLYLELRRQILDGRLPKGARLSSTRQLAGHLAISRFTVVTALERLIAEGYLETRAGSGTFVTQTLPDDLVAAAPPRRRVGAGAGASVAGVLSNRGARLSSVRITGPRPDEPRAFQARRAPLDIFPVRAWSAIVRGLWRRGSYSYLEYGDPAGYSPLREAIAAHIQATRAVQCDPRQIIITNGSQQAFDLLFRILLDPGDRAWIEEPGYLDVRGALLAAGAELVPVPVDAAGIDVEEGIRRAPRARLAVVSPSHQYPAGVTLSATRRLELLNWARATGSWIIEDDYDSYFRYSGRSMSALQGMERGSPQRSHVIYVGTFSKTVFPSLRLGFCVVPDSLVDTLVNARAVADRNSTIIDQAALAEFITKGQYERHLRRMRVICEERYYAMRHHFGRVFGDRLLLSSVSAGTHLLAHFNHGARREDPELAVRVSTLAAEDGLVVFPLSRYCLTAPAADALVLGFGGLSPRRIASGAEKLAATIRRGRRARG